MPFVVPALIAAGAATGVGLAFGSAAIVAAGGAAAFFAQTFLVAAVIGGISQALAKRPQQPSFGSAGRMLTIRQPISPRQVVFGEVRVGGTLTFARAVAREDDRELMNMVVTFAGHRCARFGRLWVNDTSIPLSSGNVPIGTKFENLLFAYRSLGDETGQPFPELVAQSQGRWRNEDMQTGCAKAYLRLDPSQRVFPQGIPNVTFELCGALVYDPRVASTGWTNNAALLCAHYLTNTDYGFGANYDEEINEDSLIAAANVCDEEVLRATTVGWEFTVGASSDTVDLDSPGRDRRLRIGDGVRVSSSGVLPGGLAADTTYYATRDAGGRLQLASTLANARSFTAIDITSAGSGTHAITRYSEPRYRANGAFLVSESPREVLARLVAAMAGKVVEVGDTWHFFAGAYTAPTFSLSERDLAGPNVVQAHLPTREAANGVRAIFTNPAAFWQAAPVPPLQSAAYLAEDGGEALWKLIDLTAFVTSASQAQRIQKIELLRGRQALTEQAAFRLKAWRAIPGQTVGRTDSQLGWTDKAFDVEEATLAVEKGEGGPVLVVKLTLRETAAAVYDWDTDEESTEDEAPNTDIADVGDVAEPGEPQITEELIETRDGRGVQVKVTVSWAATIYVYAFAGYRLEYKLSSASEWTVLPLTLGTSMELLDIEPETYDFRVKAIAANGADSDYSETADFEIQGLTAAPATPTGLQLQRGGGHAVLKLDQAPELDVRRGGRVLVRFAHETEASPSWETAFSIGEPDGHPGDATLIYVPLKPGQYLVKFRDSTGHESESYAAVDTKQASVLEFTTLDTVSYAPGFDGTHSGTAEVDGALSLGGAGEFDDIPELDAVVDLDGYGGIATDGTWTAATGIDLGAVLRVRLTGRLEGSVDFLLDQVDDRAGNVDDWLNWDGESFSGSSADAWIEVRETDDDPSGAPSWEDWKRLDAAEFEARAFQVRARLTSVDVAYRPLVTTLEVKAEELA